LVEDVDSVPTQFAEWARRYAHRSVLWSWQALGRADGAPACLAVACAPAALAPGGVQGGRWVDDIGINEAIVIRCSRGGGDAK
jgi:hypothetical protein